MVETERLQRWALGVGLAITTAGIVQVGVMPLNAPMPQPLPPQLVQQLKAGGWQQSSTIAAQARSQVSNTAGVELQRTASPGSVALKLRLVPVRVRGSQHLTIETINQAIVGKTPGQTRLLRVGADEWLRFSSGGKQQAASCIVAGEALATTKSLKRATAAAAQGGWQTRVQTTIGLKPLTNWSCIYSLLSSSERGANDKVFQQAWQELGPMLKQTRQ